MFESVDLRTVLGTLFWVCFPYLLFVMNKRPKGIKVSLNRVGWPLLGSFLRIESDWHESHAAMKRKGDVFSSHMKSEKVVVLNSEKAINEVFSKMNSENKRSSNSIHRSLFFTHGLNSDLQQKLAVCNFDLQSIELKIKLEMRHFLNLVEGYHGCQLDFDKIMDRSSANLMCLLVFGKTYQYGENELMTFIALLNETSQCAGAEAPSASCRDSHAFQKAMDICKTQIEYHRETFSEESIRDYIDDNLREMRINGNGSLSDDEFCVALIDLMVAGTEAVSSSVMWSVYALAAYPALKAKLLKEVDTLSQYTELGFAHMAAMPYVQAFVREVLRWKTVVPVSAVKRPSSSITVGDFTIPKGEAVVANYWAVTHDPDTWEDPLVLRPERFLNEDGTIKPCLGNSSFSFPTGSKKCPGESIIQLEMFLYVVNLLQTFDVCFLTGLKPNAEREAVVLNRPRNFEICMPRRRQFIRQFN